MSILARTRAATYAALLVVTGCGVRVSLGAYDRGLSSDADGGAPEVDAQEPWDGNVPDASVAAEPFEAGDDDVDAAPGPASSKD